MMKYRLDFMESIKIFLSIETFFRVIHCGITQPLKLVLFLYGWQPSWLIRLIRYFGEFVENHFSIGPTDAFAERYWFNKEVICSFPVHLDLTISFGIALFIVMCSSAR